jgi:hypothetical protein
MKGRTSNGSAFLIDTTAPPRKVNALGYPGSRKKFLDKWMVLPYDVFCLASFSFLAEYVLGHK